MFGVDSLLTLVVMSHSGYIFSASLSLSVTLVVLMMFVLTFYLRHVMQGFM